MKKVRNVMINTESDIYKVLENETSGSAKKLILAMFKLMTKDMNHIIVGGETLETLCEETGLSEAQIRNKTSELSRLHIIEPTRLIRAEYIINPVLAIKGSSNAVWKFYGELERQRGNTDASLVYEEGVVLSGKNLKLTDDDYIQVGKSVKKRKGAK